jgi:hypothetical protein
MTLAGAKFFVLDPDEQLIFFTKQKAFKLKEDIRLFANEAMEEELLVLQARKVIDFGATYDVFDPVRNETVGSLRRKGMKSMLKDEWIVFGPSEEPVALVKEDSTAMAVLRRLHEWFTLIAPQAHHIEQNGLPVARYQQNRNPFVHKIDVTITEDASNTLDPRIVLATGILIAAIEGRQK